MYRLFLLGFLFLNRNLTLKPRSCFTARMFCGPTLLRLLCLASVFVGEPFRLPASGQVQDPNRPSDIGRVLLNLQGNKTADLCWFLSRLPITGITHEFTKDVIIEADGDNCPASYVRAIGRNNTTRPKQQSVGKNVSSIDFQLPIFFAKEHDLQKHSVCYVRRVKIRSRFLKSPQGWVKLLGDPLSTRVGKFSHRLSDSDDRKEATKSTESHRPKHVEADTKFVLSGSRKIPIIIDLNDLVGKRIRLSAWMDHFAVRCSKNSGRRSANHNGRSRCRKEKTKQGQGSRHLAQQPRSPKWLRWRNNGSWSSFDDPETGAMVVDVSARDLDVSDDGRTWFHLLGPHCLQKLPNWQPRTK